MYTILAWFIVFIILAEVVVRTFFLKYYVRIGLPVYRKKIERKSNAPREEILKVLESYDSLNIEEISLRDYYVSSRIRLLSLSLRRFVPVMHGRISITEKSIVLVGYTYVSIVVLLISGIIAYFLSLKLYMLFFLAIYFVYIVSAHIYQCSKFGQLAQELADIYINTQDRA